MIQASVTKARQYEKKWLRTVAIILWFYVVLIIFFNTLPARAQCNTTLNKLLPAATINNQDRFGSDMAANGQYMVVAAENSDTLGILYSGAAYVYEKTVAGWAYRAMLTATDPDEYDFFGNEVAIDASGNTIVVINRNYTKGGMYIFEKPASGWQTMQETFSIKFPEYLEFNSALDISDDGSTIVVSNPVSPNGLLYVLQKPASGWANTMTPKTLVARSNNSGIWLGTDVLIQDDYIYASTNNESNPAIYVYKKSGRDYPLIAKLSASLSAQNLDYFGNSLTIYNDMIAATGLVYESGLITQRFFLFKKEGEWTDMNETVQFQLPSLVSAKFPYPIQFISPTELAAGIVEKTDNYYTGKVIKITSSSGTWLDVSTDTLFEEDGLTASSEFANALTWNGSDLVMATTRKYFGAAFRNAVLSLTESAGLWGSQQLTTLSRKTGSDVNFGADIVKTKDAMFAGAPYDGTMGLGAGAVYIYNQVATDFVKVNTILPSRRKTRPTGGSDAAFGYSLSVFEEELAVGAPSFLNSSNNYGKIFMYKRTTNDWKSVVLYDSLTVPDSLNLTQVGSAVAMNDHVLFASAYNNFNNEHTNGVVVFEKINDKWSYKQLIKLGKPIDRSWPSVRFSLNGDQLAVGEYFTIDGGVSIVNRNSNSGVWEVTASISGDIFSGLGGAVKLLDDHLFVGAPGASYNNIYASGAVVVFAKLPGESWRSDIQPSAIIGAQQPIEGAYFGSSLDVIGNTLVVGAPGMFLTFDSKVRTIPGNSYVIQSKDYYWKNTTQYLNLQGDRYASNERDYFGSCVVLDEDYFYVGARNENTEIGQFSGAIYYIPTPPVIFLHPPVCSGTEPFALKGYPFNGTWAGTGVDVALSTFDPKLVGAGIYTLTYSTPNCNYHGTVQIEVKAPVNIQQLSPADIVICTGVSTTLQLESITAATYNWYYKQENGTTFTWLAAGNANFGATNPGDYKAIVSKECSSESPVFHVRIENFSISVGPQSVVCSPSVPVSLITSNSTGVWEGTGVSNNKFNPAGLLNGTYKLTYRITTPTGCTISLKDSITIKAVQPLVIKETAGDFCETGAANLKAAPADNTLAYTWYYKELASESLLPINSALSDDVTVYKQGYYQASATNGKCSNVSNIIEVGFNKGLPYVLKPDENHSYNVCNADDFKVTVQAREGTIYTWESKTSDSDIYQVMTGETSHQLVIKKSGMFRVRKGSWRNRRQTYLWYHFI